MKRLTHITWLAAAAWIAMIASASSAPSQTDAAITLPAPSHPLHQADVDAWLDGFLPYALTQGDIAGAMVVIVKDGQVLTQRGFGYADIAARKPMDPSNTLVRPGSISKLFTWTAVMQLVEQGKIDLDADINRYLDFTVPSFRGQPLTMRNLMTHRTGFEQSLKGLIHLKGNISLAGDVLRRWIPERVTAPGGIPAYSNYGAGLAGYIVERVSGLPFAVYMERHIFEPLGMSHSTFREPVPQELAPLVAKGYSRASSEAKPFELVEPTSAGGSAISGPDMAKFMIAHLNGGAGMMRADTAQLMHTPAYASAPGVNRMALGFWEENIQGTGWIGHPGDTFYFHSDLWLLPAEKLGVFISMNSIGSSRASAVDVIRKELIDRFTDRYFSHTSAPVELATAKQHAKLLVGRYASSAGSFSNFLDVANLLDQTDISLDAAGRPVISSTAGPAGAHGPWIEIAPFVWEAADGHERLGATVMNGEITYWGADDPTAVRERVAWYRDSAWLRPLLIAALSVLTLTALSWPVGALARRRYGAALNLNGGDLAAHRLVGLFSFGVLATGVGWMSLLTDFIPLVDNGGSLDARIWLLQIAGTICVTALTAVSFWSVKRRSQRPRRFEKVWSLIVLLAAIVVLWTMLVFHLMKFGVHY